MNHYYNVMLKQSIILVFQLRYIINKLNDRRKHFGTSRMLTLNSNVSLSQSDLRRCNMNKNFIIRLSYFGDYVLQVNCLKSKMVLNRILKAKT